MSCCEITPEALAIQKAHNFRKMLEPYCKTPEHKEFLSKYSDDQVADLTRQYLSVLYTTGTMAVATTTIATTLEIKDEAVVEKITRYLQCFCDLLLTEN